MKDDFVELFENFGLGVREYGRAVMTSAVDAEPNYTFLISTMKVVELKNLQPQD